MKYYSLVILTTALSLGCGKSGDKPVESTPVSKPSQKRLPEDELSNNAAMGIGVKSQPLSEVQKQARAECIKALGRVEASVEVGVNYQRYTDLVIDAKAESNEAMRLLPSGELKTNLSDAIEAYQDAGMVWKYKIQYDALGLRGFWHPDILARYKFEETGKKSDSESAMQLMWRVASTKLSAARAIK